MFRTLSFIIILIFRNEVWKLVAREPYVQYSRQFVYIMLTDKRRLNYEQLLAGNVEAPALGQSYSDR